MVDVEYCRILMLNIADCVGVTFCNARTQMQKINIAFCFLVFILLYAPCVATIGVMQKEAGSAWLQFSVAWSLLLSYWLASNLWHLSLLFESPWSSLGWMFGSTAVLVLSYRAISHRVKRHYANEIPALNIL